MFGTLAYSSSIDRQFFGKWLPIVVGLLVLYLPTYFSMANSLWVKDDQAHGPIVIAVVAYLIWQQRHYLVLRDIVVGRGSLFIGWGLLFFGLLCYVVGRPLEILSLELGSQILVLAAILLLTCGVTVLRRMWFPLFFLIFMIPMPGFILDAVTLPMKIAVSQVAESVLYSFGYPIARSGVILQIGQYQLLVADACAGMHTLISLEALGLLYLNLVKHDSLFRNTTLALLIVPISFTANVIRVITLTLVTYYFGDAVGQGFVHGFAGMVLFIVALTLIMTVDTLLQHSVVRWQQRAKTGSL